MDRKLSDEQIDRIAKNLLNDFAVSDETIDEIADSPKLRWNVRNQIEAEKSRREKSWFSAFRPQTLAFGALAIVFSIGLAGWFVSLNKNTDSTTAQKTSIENRTEKFAQTNGDSTAVSPKNDSGKPEISKNSAPEKVSVKNVEPKLRFAVKNQNKELSAKQVNKSSKKEILTKAVNEETKTDFIALSYAPTTDSGQIVRVKVPGSMMVSLGVSTNVETEFVNAEVVIGDDGLARAIRFIR